MVYLPMSAEEYTQNSSKEQLDIAQKRLNTALNKLEERMKLQADGAVIAQEVQQQLFDAQTTAEDLQQEKDIISSELIETKQHYQKLKTTSQGVSEELSSSIDALESVLKKQSLLEALEA